MSTAGNIPNEEQMKQLLTHYLMLGREDIPNLSTQLNKRRAEIVAAIKAGANPHVELRLPLDSGRKTAVNDRHDIAAYLLSYWSEQPFIAIRKENIEGSSPELEAKKLCFLAKWGIDISSAMALAPFEEYAKKRAFSKKSREEQLVNLRAVVEPVQALCQNALNDFLTAPPASPERKRAVRLACAAGTFPLMLENFTRMQRHGALADATALLDDHWREQYRYTLRTAEATLARTAPVGQNALSKWGRE